MPTASKPAPARSAAKKTTDATTVDRVAELKKFFKDYAAGNEKSAIYKNEVDSASELHLLVAVEAARDELEDVDEEEAEQEYAELESVINKIGGVDVANKYGETPLHWAVVAKSSYLTEVFIKHGADVNARSDYGAPLHYQAAIGYGISIFDILLNAGADVKLRNKQKKLPINYLRAPFKGYFQEQVEAHRIRLLAREFKAGRRPSLSLDAMSDAIEGALSLHDAHFEHEGNPNYYLQKNGVYLRFGSPYCSTCKMSFGDEKKYARHMMSIDHILKYADTTEAAMLEARAYLEAKGMFHSLYRQHISKEEALKGYAGGGNE